MILQYKTGKYTVPIKQPELSLILCDLYDKFNTKKFGPFYIPDIFLKFVRIVAKSFNQKPKIKTYRYEYTYKCNNKKVLLGFSGGLDSCYQALQLRRKGYNVSLYYCMGMNKYENGQADRYVHEFAKKFKFNLIIMKMSGVKYWAENPIKNQLLLAFMIDYCKEHKYGYISLGDDFNLSIKDAVPGTNTTDAREVTKAFLNPINIKLLPVKGNKLSRIKYLHKYNVEYYSCVAPGRFHKKWHDYNSKKYSVKLPEGNCGSCRKCCMHWLLENSNNAEFEKHCWEIMYRTKYNADAYLFSPNIPLKQRRKNLLTY